MKWQLNFAQNIVVWFLLLVQEFHVSKSLDLESSSAEELFSDGRILPTDVKRKNASLMQTPQSTPHPPLHPSYAGLDNDSKGKKLKWKSLKEIKYLNEVCEKQSSSKSFWSFKRSSSCGSGYGRSLCPLPLLSRSNSTGSTSSRSKRNSYSKEGINIKQNSQKLSSTRFSHSFGQNSYQKPPLNNKSHGFQSHGNCVRVNPVLSVFNLLQQ